MKNLLFLILLLNIQIITCYSQSLKGNSFVNKKIALVIGVSKYQYASQLKNTINDAKDMNSTLSSLGYNVRLLLDPSLKEMTAAIDTFGKKLSSANIGLFYYSGHGAELNGENFIFPITAHPTIPDDLVTEAYPLRKVISRITLSKVKTSIVLLDACRSNPFTRSWVREFGYTEGLSIIEIPNGSFIGYAASPGKVASDGIRSNGTYTEAILKYIKEKDQSIDQIFNKVNKEVRIQSSGNQIPFKSSSLDGDFFFSTDRNKALEDDKTTNEAHLLKLRNKKFPLPKGIKGYAISPISNYAKVNINKLSFKNDEFIELTITLLDKIIWDQTTPIYVTVVKLANKTAEGGVLQLENEYQPNALKHNIKLLTDFEPGIYKVRIGFYFVSELNGEYPTLNNKAFTITVQ